MKINDSIINSITREFLFRTVGEEIPEGYCFSICYPLSILFTLLDIPNQIEFGSVNHKGISVSHFWIKFDNNGTILDPTIRQFVHYSDPFYFGDINESPVKINNKIIERTWEEEFPEIYQSWSEIYYGKAPTIPRTSEFILKMKELNRKAALTLLHFIDKYQLSKELEKFEYGKLYFKPIFAFYSSNRLS